MGKLDKHMQNNEIGPLSYHSQKINSKCITDLTQDLITIKLSRNIERKLLNSGTDNDFWI